MKAVTIILGIIMMVCGVSCMITPLSTFLSMGYFFGIMFFVYGLMGVIRALTKKDMSTVQVIMSVLALIVGIIAIAKPGSTLAIDAIILGFVAAWFIIQGASQMVMAWKIKDLDKSWIWWFIIGILGIILGIYCLMHPKVAALTAGFLLGFSFLETGFNMLTLAIAAGKKDKN